MIHEHWEAVVTCSPMDQPWLLYSYGHQEINVNTSSPFVIFLRSQIGIIGLWLFMDERELVLHSPGG